MDNQFTGSLINDACQSLGKLLAAYSDHRLKLDLTAEDEASTVDALQWVAKQVKLGRTQASNSTATFCVDFILVPFSLME